MKNLAHLNPYQLHTHLINEYILIKPGSTKQLLERDRTKDKHDIDVIRENHRFLWEDSPQTSTADITWEQQLAKKYYDKLFKEYTICDLVRYKENKIALRWRIETEVVQGKGQFVCGNKVCSEKDELKTWEVNFAYVEHGEKKNALVKLRLCPTCSGRLNYRTKKREIKRLKKKTRKSLTTGTTAETTSGETSSAESRDDTGKRMDAQKDEADSHEEDEQRDTEEKIEKISQQCWTKATDVEDKSREEEFDEFLEDLLL